MSEPPSMKTGLRDLLARSKRTRSVEALSHLVAPMYPKGSRWIAQTYSSKQRIIGTRKSPSRLSGLLKPRAGRETACLLGGGIVLQAKAAR